MNLPSEPYCSGHSSAEHPYLAALYRATQTTLLRPRMASGHLQGLLLKMLVEMTGARRIVEIGTYSGYSALAMASGMETPSGALRHLPLEGEEYSRPLESNFGKVTTFEINDEQEDFTRPWIDNSPWADRVELVIGDALDIIPQRDDLTEIDLCFIDANKRHYKQYFDILLPRVRKGGLIVCDNTLWDGHLEETDRHDPQTVAIREFNDYIAEREDVETLLLPLRDGLTIIRKNN